MDNKEILQKAIEKAEDNGFDFYADVFEETYFYMARCGANLDYYFITKGYYSLIFSHEFARAFWRNNGIRGWTYHLKQMVLAKEPLKYLEKFLND